MGNTIETKWDVHTYDVWGNARDGYEVNDIYTYHRGYELTLDVEILNAGTTMEFETASPTDKQIKKALGIKPQVRIETDGDDQTIYVKRGRDGYPIGELLLVNPKSLSPISK